MAVPAAPENKCERCEQPVSVDAPEGICPACVLEESLLTLSSSAEHLNLPVPELANYSDLELIGQGGMGVVYKGRQKNPARTVALKLISSGALASGKEIRRFQAEVHAVAKLRHQNIVTVYEVGEQNGQHFFSMEYVDGESLSASIQNKKLSFNAAAGLIRKVAEAVHYAHEQGVLHRDLKPANILIDTRGEPRITDFGLAQQRELPSDLTRSGTILGTPSYMPPEQAQGRTREITPASDVYALGAILYEALTGRAPFQAESLLETLRQVVSIPPAAPRLLNPKVPRDLEVICLKCLRKEPSQRYDSAEELARDLDRYLRKEPIHARPIGIVERNVAWCLRNPLPAAALTTAAVLLLLLAIAAFLFRTDSVHRNAAAARVAARVLETYLRDVSKELLALSGSPELGKMVAARNSEALIRLLEEKQNDLRQDARFKDVFQNWIVLGANGDLIARVPPRGSFTNRAVRDYFIGATNLFSKEDFKHAHFSKVYKSRDDTFFKIGISAPVMAEGRLAGVVGMMVKTFSTEVEPLGLWDERQKTVVLAKWDHSSTPAGAEPMEWVIWLHPKFQQGADAIPVWKDMRIEGKDRSWLYFDPASQTFPEYRGPWVAGFAPVAGTPFVVVVQSRDWVGLSMAGGVLALVISAGFAGWLRHKRKAQTAL